MEMAQLNHKMTKSLEGLEVEVEIRMRYVDKIETWPLGAFEYVL